MYDDNPPIRIIANPYSHFGAGLDHRLVDGECLILENIALIRKVQVDFDKYMLYFSHILNKIMGILPSILTDTELRLHIQRQIKQKHSLEYELDKEREKLQMIRLDIVTLTSPCMTHGEMKELCDEITRLRSVCERLADDIDSITETSEILALI